MRVLVTGGAGFIGSNLVEALIARGDEVVVLDNFSTGHRHNLAALEGEIELVEGDLRSYERVHAAVRRCETVFHYAALPSVPRSIQDPLTSSDVNVGGTLNIVLAARDEGVRRVIFASSSSIYGDAPGMPRKESMTPKPLAPYAVSKLAAEQYCRVATEVYGFETLSLRLFNVFGKRQDPGSQYSAVVPRFIGAFRSGLPPTIFGSGEQARDFTHVVNVVEANMLAAGLAQADGQILNIACGEKHSINELASMLRPLCGTDLEPRYEPERPGEVPISQADISSAEELLGYRPSVGFEEGLRLTVEEFESS